MKCVSCETEIPSSWVSAIANNLCPACGSEIQSGERFEILKELTQALEKMDKDAAGLAGWIMSSFEIRKIGTVEPIEFYGKTKQSHQNIDEPNIKIAPPNKFMKQAGVDNIVKNSEATKLLQILNEVNKEAEQQINGYEEVANNGDEEMSYEDQKNILLNATKEKGRPLTKREANNVLKGGTSLFLDEYGNPTSQPNTSGYIKPIQQNFNNSGGDEEPTLGFLEEDAGNYELNADRRRRLEQSQRIAQGLSAGKGGFKRGD